jgi:hypothetical protein
MPRPEDYVTRQARVIARPPLQCNGRYVPLEECDALWEANKSVDHADVDVQLIFLINRVMQAG